MQISTVHRNNATNTALTIYVCGVPPFLLRFYGDDDTASARGAEDHSEL